MSKNIFVFISMLFPLLGNSQNWVNTFGSSDWDEGGAVALDYKNNLLVAGNFTNSIDVDPSSAVKSIVSKGNSDIFILKTTSSGGLIWAKSFGSKLADQLPKLKVDARGNSYLSFKFRDSIQVNVRNKDTVFTTTPGFYATILIKMNPDGSVIWAKSLGSKGLVVTGLTMGLNGDIWLAGNYANEVVDLDMGIGSAFVGNQNGSGTFVARYDSANFAFKGACDLKGLGSLFQLAVSKYSGKVVLAGSLSPQNNLPFQKGDSVVTVTTTLPCLIELEPSLMKVKKALPYRMSSSSYAFNKMDFDAEDNLIIVGFWGYSDFDAGLIAGESLVRPTYKYEDILYVKYTKDFHLVWCFRFSGPTQSWGYALSVESGGNFYVSANVGYANPIDIDPGSGSTVLDGGSYVAKYDADGHLLWYGRMVAQSTVVVRDIVLDVNGVVYGAGLYQGANAQLNAGNPAIISPFVGVFDAYYFRYFPSVVTGTQYELLEKEMVLAYPNPCRNSLSVTIPYDLVELFDVSGKCLRVFRDTPQLDIMNIPSGLHTLFIHTKEKTWVMKIIKE